MKRDVLPMEKDGYVLRLAQECDVEEYYQQGFNPQDAEIIRLTGSKPEYSHDDVVKFFIKCLTADDRYDFLIISPDGRIIGESVINEIDWDIRSANYRVALFHTSDCGKGIGSWAIGRTRDFAFKELGLHRLSLSVFSFNHRAQKAYIAAGFKREGILRDAVKDDDIYADDILMAMLEDDWREITR